MHFDACTENIHVYTFYVLAMNRGSMWAVPRGEGPSNWNEATHSQRRMSSVQRDDAWVRQQSFAFAKFQIDTRLCLDIEQRSCNKGGCICAGYLSRFYCAIQDVGRLSRPSRSSSLMWRGLLSFYLPLSLFISRSYLFSFKHDNEQIRLANDSQGEDKSVFS